MKIETLPEQTGIFKTLLLCLPMIFFTLVMLSSGNPPTELLRLAVFAATFIFVNAIFFMMIRTGQTDRWRAILFIVYAVCFVISFITHLIEARGSMAISQSNMIEGLTPFCHIVIPMTLIPAALTKTIIFPGTILGTKTAIASMFVLWIGSSLALGRGFCGWVCFFGGLDDGFSRLFRKTRVKNIHHKWTYLPYAILLLIVLVSALTRKRTQCSLFCPFGAFQSFTNKVNVFDVRVDPEKCIRCEKCIQTCPTFSIFEDTIEKGKTAMTCMKCGRCMDACKQKAIFYHVKGTPLTGEKAEIYRRLFLYPAFIFLATMAGGPVQDAILKMIKLVTTGSMI